MLIDADFIKKLEQQELSCCSAKVEETAVKPKVVAAEPTKIKSVKCSCNCNPATNWWLALIAFLLFLMLCLNPNFE